MIDLVAAGQFDKRAKDPADVKRVIRIARDAKKYVFDRSASQYWADAINQTPRLIADAHDFAIKPYPNMWVELSGEGLSDTTLMQWGSEHYLGFLFAGEDVYVFTRTFEGAVVMSFVVYQPMKPFADYAEVEAFAASYGIDMWELESRYWGRPAETLTSINADSRRRLLINNRFRIAGSQQYKNLVAVEPEFDMLSAEGGELSGIIALLILLNRTRNVEYRRETHARSKQRMIGNKVGLQQEHTVISFNLSPMPILKQLLDAPGLTGRPLHEVAGHMCQNKRLQEANCLHQSWEATAWTGEGENRSARQWRCVNCSGLKWWREYHLRGDPKYGIVTSEYAVTN